MPRQSEFAMASRRGNSASGEFRERERNAEHDALAGTILPLSVPCERLPLTFFHWHPRGQLDSPPSVTSSHWGSLPLKSPSFRNRAAKHGKPSGSCRRISR